MGQSCAWFLLIVLISILQQSGVLASSPWSMQNLARAHHLYYASDSEEAPLPPSPSPSALPGLEKVNKTRDLFVPPPVPSPSDIELALTDDPCSGKFRICHANNYTACLQYARNARESFLIIQKSGGEIPSEVNVTFLPSNVTSRESSIPATQLTNKVNVTDGIQGSSSIVVDVGGEECILDTNLEGHRLLHPPSYGIIVFLVITIVVGAWGYYLYRLRRSRHGMTESVRIPYEKVSTRVSPSRPLGVAVTTSTKDIETGTVGDGEGWNKSWGEEEGGWDEGKTVAAAAGCLQRKHGGGSPANSTHKAD